MINSAKKIDAYTGGMTLREVGEELNISAERVRQIEESALRKMKQKLYKVLKG